MRGTLADGLVVTDASGRGALKASLAEKEILLKEIHHRVKNNMQVISSLVALQAERLPDAATREVLQDVSHRVRSMALVHEKLYQSADMARVEFAEYAQSLLNYLWRAHGTTASRVRLALDLEPVPLSVNAAVPCGLILNELASNALKHAFHGRADGERGGIASRQPGGPGLPPRARQWHGPAGGTRLAAGRHLGPAPGANARRTTPCRCGGVQWRRNRVYGRVWWTEDHENGRPWMTITFSLLKTKRSSPRTWPASWRGWATRLPGPPRKAKRPLPWPAGCGRNWC